MASVSAYYVTGLTVKAAIRNDSLLFADVILEAMESYDALSIADYDITCTEIGNTGEYHATWPTWLDVGLYTIQFMPLAGGTIAETDFLNRFAAQSYYYDGTNLIPDWAFKIAGIASPVTDSGEKRVKDILVDTATLGTPVALDGGAATVGGMLTKMADDNGGADFDATTDSLEAIGAKVILLGTGSVTVSSPVASDTKVSLRRGDDQQDGIAGALEWSSTGGDWLGGDITSATVAFRANHKRDGTNINKAGSIISPTATQVVRVELTSTETVLFTENGSMWDYGVQVTSSTGGVQTIAANDVTVFSDIFASTA